ncbi:LysR family transcriptional regulator ArgP [Plantactinospora sp. GCM10030261]|uniref:LysR family transcriptional regulator ArgP n=1 Tax=Plantactinospora sp. GCM10030261 TaxID=3273420 RepID=UPI00360D735C
MVDLDSSQLRTLAVVVAEGSFEAAAQALHVTPSAVSQRIKALEAAVGQVLVRRSRPSRVTDAGKPLLRLAGQFALLEREALDAARIAPAGGPDWTRVALVVNADSLATWFLDALARLPAEPRLAFEIHTNDEGHTAELLRDGTAMAAVTAESEPVQGCRVERLGAMRYLAVAAPALADRYFADGLTPDALAAAPVMVYDRRDQTQHRFIRAVTGRLLDPPVRYVPSVPGFSEAIRLGLGWGLVPEALARPDLAGGRCVDLAPGRHVDVPLYWQHWRLDSVVLRSLADAVREAAAVALR